MNKLLREAEKYDLINLSQKIVKRANHPDCLVKIRGENNELLCILATGEAAEAIVNLEVDLCSKTET